MAASINIPAYSDALVVLGTAGIVVPLVQRCGLNPVLGYLGAGALLGPLGLGSFVNEVPALYWFVVSDARNVSGIADLGVVFLLFLIGLELSFERLKAMARLIFGLGSLQIAVSTAALAAIFVAAGQPKAVAVMLGAALALSSTAIVLEVLARQGRLTTNAGRASFAVLLAQDLAVIPILIFVSILATKSDSPVLTTAATTLLEATAAVAVIAIVGRVLLRPLLRLVVGTQSRELFIAAVLFVIVATAVVAGLAGLSMALGAFVAGLLLAETEYRKTIEVTVEPFKGLLLGIFFFTVGMGIDARELLREPLWLLGCVAGLIALKAAIMIALARLYGLSWAVAVEMGLLLGPGGEFAFVAVGLAATLEVVSQQLASFVFAVTSLTMALIPVMASLSRRVAPRFEPLLPADPELAVPPEPRQHHAIVVGYGRVGKVVCGLLKRHHVAFTAIDHDPTAIARERRQGHAVHFGDASEPSFLKACGVLDASAVVITIHNHAMVDDILRAVRALRPDIPVFCRARDAHHARHLYALGVTDAVPETIEASLQLSEAALVGVGIPTGRVIASIHEERVEMRQALKEQADAVEPVAAGGPAE